MRAADHPGGYGLGECFVCGRPIRITDPFADRRVRDLDGDLDVRRGHRACLREGVERWCREGRPLDSPLSASRDRSWSWHDDPPTRLDS